MRRIIAAATISISPAMSQTPPKAPTVFVQQTTEGWFTALPREVGRELRYRTVWMRGDHDGVTKVAYRTSLWHIRFDCAGMFQVDAATTRRADDSIVDNWDAPRRPFERVRPGSLYALLENWTCSQP